LAYGKAKLRGERLTRQVDVAVDVIDQLTWRVDDTRHRRRPESVLP